MPTWNFKRKKIQIFFPQITKYFQKMEKLKKSFLEYKYTLAKS
jgi:hypothetical protein